mmetsp:Transcript_6390/g.20481  ORF Transcript_6390/g.20481 Transcript_6390/m.20481 type:complete len:98 (-) Transcript_6390:186-479(-)
MLLCGMQAFALGLGLLWEGATLPPPHAPFEPPHFATEPQLARVMLAAGWTVALVVLRFLAARAPLLGIEAQLPLGLLSVLCALLALMPLCLLVGELL